MTAIFGRMCSDGRDLRKEGALLAASLQRFGPDGTASMQIDDALLGRNLHAGLAEDRFDNGPVLAPGSRYAVVADVRLTERRSLLDALDLTDAERLSDAGLVALAIERWHDDAFEHLYGDFAVAAWDRTERRLLLARDHFGYRPLFYHRSPADGVSFSSMPQGLHALPHVPKGFDPAVIRRFLRSLQPVGSQTAYQDIERVRPGHYAIVSADGARQTRYWRPDCTPLRLPDHASYQAGLAERFEAAVAATLRDAGDLVGAQLSSGFDSTAVVTTAARQLAATDPQARLLAFTAVPRPGFHRPDTAFQIHDEGALAAQTARSHRNIEHMLVQPYDSPLTTLDRAATIYGAPVLNLCNEAWIAAINDAARQRAVTVMLGGFMGNATISDTGHVALVELMLARRWRSWWRIAHGLVRRGKARWRGILWQTLGPVLPQPFWRAAMRLRGKAVQQTRDFSALRGDLWTQETAAYRDGREQLHPLDRSWDGEVMQDPRSSIADRTQMMNFDSGAYHKAVLANWNIDVRDPTGDRRLVEYSLRVPIEHFIWDGEPRAMLRHLLADRAPAEVVDDDRYGVQAADWAMGMGHDLGLLRAEVERLAAFAPSAELIDVDRLRSALNVWDRVDRGGTPGIEAIRTYRIAMLRAISAGTFMRKATGSNV